ncbi:hypothetical protein AVEN_86008-1 [Araneus ventricosus]|uniref:CCHC-type domain-containing protein n=1 Tax=Araneus ventricosus TaxID=182803 RepID=A0A4Y2UTJ6_ARAVE|nr:hypothetical protein AVEN_86008-1 [Araneus ventricosus]
MRKGGQLLDTKHLVLTFHGSKIPESIKAGYVKLAVRHYLPNPLRCFKCQRFGHSKTSCRKTLTCARCTEAGHDSSDCTASEKCVNCKGSHTSFSRSCSAWKLRRRDNITVENVSQFCKPPQFTDKEPSEVSNFVTKQSNITVTKNGTKSSYVCSVGLVPESMAVFPPEKAKVLQSLESGADAEMSSSSASEGDTLEYNMSEDNNPLTPSGPQNLTTFVYGGFVDIWIREMDSSAFSLFLLTVGGRKITGA